MVITTQVPKVKGIIKVIAYDGLAIGDVPSPTLVLKATPKATIQSANTPYAHDVLMKHITGTHELVFATIRKNVSVAVYDAQGSLLYMTKLPESSQNDIVMITNADGVDELVDVYTPLATFTLPQSNQFYFYVFFENDKRKIASGKILLTK